MPPTYSRSEFAAGHRLFAEPWDFVTAAASIESLPRMDGIEIAFAGRSNVGKSSLINALTERKALARTSHTPGRTQELIFFGPFVGWSLSAHAEPGELRGGVRPMVHSSCQPSLPVVQRRRALRQSRLNKVDGRACRPSRQPAQ